MKDQASLHLKIVDDPISANALDGCLSIRATSQGLVVTDSSGISRPIGDLTIVMLTTASSITLSANTWYVLQAVVSGTLPPLSADALIKFSIKSLGVGSIITPATNDLIEGESELLLDVADQTIVLYYQADQHNWLVLH